MSDASFNPELPPWLLLLFFRATTELPQHHVSKEEFSSELRRLSVHDLHLQDVAEVINCSLSLFTFSKCILIVHWKRNSIASLFFFFFNN